MGDGGGGTGPGARHGSERSRRLRPVGSVEDGLVVERRLVSERFCGLCRRWLECTDLRDFVRCPGCGVPWTRTGLVPDDLVVD